MKYDESYLEFYGEYPRKEGKADGQKAWHGLTEGDRKAALADVRKRKRMGAYSSNKKLVQLPASYCRARRWEDDWEDTLESSRKNDDDRPNTGMPTWKPSEVVELPWRERLINRCFKSYMMTTIGIGGLPEVNSALKIKHEVLQEAKMLESDPPAEQAETIADLFVSRMDLHYGLNLKRQALKNARRAKRV